MKASPECYELLRHYEDCRLVAYPDPASPLAVALRRALPTAGLSGAPWTIGYGETGPHVYKGLAWTQEQAETALERKVAQFEADVNHLLEGHQVKQCQFDALVSFAYNVGSDIDQDRIAEGLGDSTLLRLLLAGDVTGSANEFLKWDRAQGRVLRGLTKRRHGERALFMGATASQAIATGERAVRA